MAEKMISVGTRGLSFTAAGIIASLTALFLVHSNFVIPSVIHEARKEIRTMIQEHSLQPHEGAVRQDQFDSIMRLMQSQLNRIEQKVDNIRGQ